jgi:hypothetical protein
MNGKQITELEKTDVSRLKAAGWKPPTPFSVKSANGKNGCVWYYVHANQS